jgi:hypothetical protein
MRGNVGWLARSRSVPSTADITSATICIRVCDDRRDVSRAPARQSVTVRAYRNVDVLFDHHDECGGATEGPRPVVQHHLDRSPASLYAMHRYKLSPKDRLALQSLPWARARTISGAAACIPMHPPGVRLDGPGWCLSCSPLRGNRWVVGGPLGPDGLPASTIIAKGVRSPPPRPSPF